MSLLSFKKKKIYTSIFVFSTGRCGTKHLSEIFEDKNSYVTHEEEHLNTIDVLEKFLRPISIKNDRTLAIDYITKYKIPFIASKLKQKNANIFMDTGHLIIYGIAPYLVTHISDIKLIRLRRDRYETVKSFMSRPPEYDIWNKKTYQKNYRWSAHPFDKINVLAIPKEIWENFNRFQKYLWAIDEVERKWNRLISNFNFPYIEIRTEEFSKSCYDKISDFTKIKYNTKLIGVKHNTSEERNAKKVDMKLSYMKHHDENYQKIIQCLQIKPNQRG